MQSQQICRLRHSSSLNCLLITIKSVWLKSLAGIKGTTVIFICFSKVYFCIWDFRELLFKTHFLNVSQNTFWKWQTYELYGYLFLHTAQPQLRLLSVRIQEKV